jgi:Helix-turn-helix domain
VALLCNMSPSRFCREFKAAFDATFVEYLANYRMQQAKRLLANPRMPVADVAVAVGFNDPSYFTRVFRKQEGASPSEYRATTVFESNRLRASGGGLIRPRAEFPENPRASRAMHGDELLGAAAVAHEAPGIISLLIVLAHWAHRHATR